MSILQYVFSLLVVLTVAIEAKKILRAQAGAATTGNFMVVLDKGVSSERFRQLVQLVGGNAEDQKVYSQVDGIFAKVITAKLSEEALEQIKFEADVEFIEEETFTTIDSIEEQIKFAEPKLMGDTFPSGSTPWHLDRVDQRKLPLDGASFNVFPTGTGVDIYILDTGIRYSHDEFGGRAKYPGYDVIDEDTGTNEQGLDCNGHGTHVAALAGGSTYGMAKGATLYSVRVLDCSNSGSWSGAIKGINYAATQIKNSGRPGIISMSLGGSRSTAANNAVEEAVKAGVTVIVAAGNENTDACSRSFASAPSAISVGATDINDARAWFSNYGTCVDMFAPGVDITSASYSCDSCTVVYSGTSMACPIVSGLAAVFLDVVPSLSPDSVDYYLGAVATKGAISDVRGSPNELLFTYPGYYA